MECFVSLEIPVSSVTWLEQDRPKNGGYQVFHLIPFFFDSPFNASKVL